jgi:hypothetical protein
MSRPFEGVIYLALLGICVLTGRRGRPWQGFVAGCALPAMLVLGVGLALLGYYNFHVTGHALLPPDVQYTRQFMAAPRFWWQAPSPDKSFPNEALRAFHRGSEWDEYARQTTPGGFARAQFEKAVEVGRRWLATPLTSLLLVPPVLWAAWTSRRARWLGLIVLAVPAIEFALTPWFRPHYTAVLGAALFAALTLGLRRVAAWRPAVAWGLFGVVIAGHAVAAGGRLRRTIDQPNVAGLPRQMLIDNLARLPGRHVVFVRYADGPQTVVEWVYNGASPDEQPILFARDLGDAANRALLSYAPDRSAWRVIVRGVQFEVEPIRNASQRK